MSGSDLTAAQAIALRYMVTVRGTPAAYREQDSVSCIQGAGAFVNVNGRTLDALERKGYLETVERGGRWRRLALTAKGKTVNQVTE